MKMNLKREWRIWRFKNTRAAKERKKMLIFEDLEEHQGTRRVLLLTSLMDSFSCRVMTDTSEISREVVLVLELRLVWA
jgi:hypothetical protein